MYEDLRQQIINDPDIQGVLQIGHDLPIREMLARINAFIDEHGDEIPDDDDDDDDAEPPPARQNEEIREYNRISAIRSSQRAIPRCLPVEPVDSHMVLLELTLLRSIINKTLTELKEDETSSGI
jgi:hypothetical protein